MTEALLSNPDIDQAVEQLTQLSMRKAAADAPSIPVGRNALIGAGLGAGLGGINALAAGPHGRKRRGSLSRILSGALFGGIAGGAGTLGYHGLTLAADSLASGPEEARRRAAAAELEKARLAGVGGMKPGDPTPGYRARMGAAGAQLKQFMPELELPAGGKEFAKNVMPSAWGAAVGGAGGYGAGILANEGLKRVNPLARIRRNMTAAQIDEALMWQPNIHTSNTLSPGQAIHTAPMHGRRVWGASTPLHYGYDSPAHVLGNLPEQLSGPAWPQKPPPGYVHPPPPPATPLITRDRIRALSDHVHNNKSFVRRNALPAIMSLLSAYAGSNAASAVSNPWSQNTKPQP